MQWVLCSPTPALQTAPKRNPDRGAPNLARPDRRPVCTAPASRRRLCIAAHTLKFYCVHMRAEAEFVREREPGRDLVVLQFWHVIRGEQILNWRVSRIGSDSLMGLCVHKILRNILCKIFRIMLEI